MFVFRGFVYVEVVFVVFEGKGAGRGVGDDVFEDVEGFEGVVW